MDFEKIKTYASFYQTPLKVLGLAVWSLWMVVWAATRSWTATIFLVVLFVSVAVVSTLLYNIVSFMFLTPGRFLRYSTICWLYLSLKAELFYSFFYDRIWVPAAWWTGLWVTYRVHTWRCQRWINTHGDPPSSRLLLLEDYLGYLDTLP